LSPPRPAGEGILCSLLKITANNVSGVTSAAGVLAVSAALLFVLCRTGVDYCG